MSFASTIGRKNIPSCVHRRGHIATRQLNISKHIGSSEIFLLQLLCEIYLNPETTATQANQVTSATKQTTQMWTRKENK